MEFLIRVTCCIIAIALWMYGAVDNQNRLTQLRIEIPHLTEEVEKIREENIRIAYEIERFENPANLMELSRLPEYGHLKYPCLKDVLVLPDDEAFQ